MPHSPPFPINPPYPAKVWIVSLGTEDNGGLWGVGADSEAEARDMVSRHIGDAITGCYEVHNFGKISHGELRQLSDGVDVGRGHPTFEPDPFRRS